MKLKALTTAVLLVLLAVPSLARADIRQSAFTQAGPMQSGDLVPVVRGCTGTWPNLTGCGNYTAMLTQSSVGSVLNTTATAHQFLTGIGSSGVFTTAQPAFSDLTGTLAAGQIPAPQSAALGGVFSMTPVANAFLTGIGTTGAFTYAQPTFANIYGTATNSQLANSAITIAGHSVSLGSAQTLAASDLTNGVTGTGAVVLAASPTLSGTVTGGTFAGTHTGNGSGLTGLTVSQVSGVAPTASPTFTGIVTVPSISINGGNVIGYGVGANSLAVGSSGNLANLTGAMNTIVGDNNMTGATTALGNTFIGFQSGTHCLGCQNNSAVGLDTLFNAVTNTVNDSAVGVYALVNDIGYGGNSAIGYTSLGSNTSGFENSAIGESSCGSVTTGHDNTCLGIWTGFASTQMVGSGSNNVLIGSVNQFGSVQPVTVVNSNQSNFLNISNAISADMQTAGRPYLGLGLGSSTIPVYDISLNASHGSTISPQQPSGTTSAAGGAVTVQGGAGIGTNQPGGVLTLSSGAATGASGSSVYIKTYTPVASGSTSASLASSVNVDAYGDLFVGDAANAQADPALSSGGIYPIFNVSGIDAKTSTGIVSRYSADANPPTWAMSKSRGATRGSLTAVVSGDNTGQILADGYSGANYLDTGKIVFGTEGTVSTTSVPGNLTIQTASASGILTNAIRVNSLQQVGIGTVSPTAALDVNGAINLKGVNGLSYPSTDTTANGTIAVGAGALAAAIGTTLQTSDQSVAVGYGAYQVAVGTTGTPTQGVAIGYRAAYAQTIGYNNNIIGWNALFNCTACYWTNAIGHDALGYLTSGYGNTALGEGAAYQWVSGNENTFIGDGTAVFANGSGSSNTLVGAHVANGSTGGFNYNTAVGENAGSVLAADGNTLVGTNAGAHITTGQHNLVLGTNAGNGTLATGQGNVLLCPGSTTCDMPASGTNYAMNLANAIYVTGITGSPTAIAGLVGIGTNNPAYPLTVIGTSSASSFSVGSTAGVSCSGAPTASFAVTNGIVTHC